MDEYNKKHETLGERITNLTKLCREATKSLLCAKYQDVLTHLYDEVTYQRDNMYLSLGKSDNSSQEEEVLFRRK